MIDKKQMTHMIRLDYGGLTVIEIKRELDLRFPAMGNSELAENIYDYLIAIDIQPTEGSIGSQIDSDTI